MSGSVALGVGKSVTKSVRVLPACAGRAPGRRPAVELREARESAWVGVGTRSRVGDDPDPLSQVGCPELTSGKARPLRVIPCLGQVSENSSDRRPVPPLAFPGEERGHVLHEDVAGSKLANESGELGPKTRAGAVDPGALAGGREVLAGEATAEDVDRGERPRPDLADVLQPARAGEVPREDAPAPRVELDLPGDLEPRPLEAEVEAADPREEAADIHPALLVVKRGR